MALSDDVISRKIIIYKFAEVYKTNLDGINQLFSLYYTLAKFEHHTIALHFYDMKFFDGNLTALLAAILHKLSKENNLTFTTDMLFVRNEFDFFLKNDFFQDGEKVIDNEKNTLPLGKFFRDDKEDFISYLDNRLLQHDGLPKSNQEILVNIKVDLIEIFCNYNYHSRTKEPCFICGHYFPEDKILKLTITDLGCGFLDPIKETTGIENTEEAIKWALTDGKTSIKGTPGGIGFKIIKEYAAKKRLIFQIITNDQYWDSDPGSIYEEFNKLAYPFCGTTINLFFSWK